MTSMWPCAVASLDEALASLRENVRKLASAQSTDIAEMLEQLQAAAESARLVRELVSTHLPDASWQNREELDALMARQLQNSPEAPMGGIFPADLAAEPAPA